ncbi:MAG: hypothetical protein HC804_12800, partial [Anaerolineae bacterium]|nr:hypothetical protein [Anaerolineae bacterium]
MANEAIWRPEVTAQQARTIYAASMADFGVCQASQQAWNVQDWLALMQQTGFTVINAPL